MTVSELRRLKDIEAENAELRRLLADAMLDNAGLKGLLEKTPDACAPSGCREDADGQTSVQGAAGVQAGWNFAVELDLSSPTRRKRPA